MEDLIVNILNNFLKYQVNYFVLDLIGLDKEFIEYMVSFIEKLGVVVFLIGMKIILVGIFVDLGLVILKIYIDLLKYDCF